MQLRQFGLIQISVMLILGSFSFAVFFFFLSPLILPSHSSSLMESEDLDTLPEIRMSLEDSEYEFVKEVCDEVRTEMIYFETEYQSFASHAFSLTLSSPLPPLFSIFRYLDVSKVLTHARFLSLAQRLFVAFQDILQRMSSNSLSKTQSWQYHLILIIRMRVDGAKERNILG